MRSHAAAHEPAHISRAGPAPACVYSGVMDTKELESILARRDLEAAEGARDHVGPHAMFLANHYWQTQDWVERSLVVHMVQDQRGPHLRSVFSDFLRAPEPAPGFRDHVELTKAVCLVQLKGDLSLFPRYLNDREALRRDILAEISDAPAAPQLLGTPTPVAAPAAPAPFTTPARPVSSALVAPAAKPISVAAKPSPAPWAAAPPSPPAQPQTTSGVRIVIAVAAVAMLVLVLAGVVAALLVAAP